MDYLQDAVLATLKGPQGDARFVQEMRAALAVRDVLDGDFESALAELERREAIIVRPQFCGDPHLDGADLRIAALLAARNSGGDAQAAAMTAIESTWQRWIGDYLANHRCT